MKPQTKARLFDTVGHAVGYLPLWANRALGRLIGELADRVPNRSRAVTERNLSLCLPELSPDERRRLRRQSLIETGKTLAEIGMLWRWPIERLRALMREEPGYACVEAALAQGRGVLLLAPHMGAWELGGLLLSGRFPLTIMYRPSRTPALDAPLKRARERYGARLVPADTSGVRAVLAALKRGEVAIILPDQEPSFGQGEFAPFFGQPAYTLQLVARLLSRTQAVPVFTHVERLPGTRGYRSHFQEASDALGSENLNEALTALNAGVEALARTWPAQYLWSYKRFRTRPDGEPSFYD